MLVSLFECSIYTYYSHKNDSCIEKFERLSTDDKVVSDKMDTDDDISENSAGAQQQGSSKTKVRTKVENEFCKFLKNLPEELKGKIDPKQMKTVYENAKSFKLLVTGKTGSGKSTLVNGILGVTLPDQAKAKEGSSITKACTTDVKAFNTKKEDIDMTIWDSPGLQDGTDNEDYLQQMKEMCQERDLTMYCIDVHQIRFISGDDTPDVVAMKKLTREFGPQFWSNTVIVLTFSNYIADDVHIKYLPLAEKKIAVEAKLQEWKNQIVHILTHDVEIDQQVAEKILIVPAGYYREPDLPVCKFWLSNLWFHCFAAVSTQEGQLVLLKATLKRLKKDTDVQEDDFEQPIGQQPIVYNDSRIEYMLRKANVIGGVGGFITLGTIGALIGIVGGPPGIIVGLIVGAYFGAVGGAVAGSAITEKLD